MISSPVIENFNELVEPHLNGAKIISYKSRFLTKPCENYGSTMLAVTAKVQTKSGITEELELVAKIPPMNEIYWKFFQTKVTFIIENNFYIHVAPALQQFQKMQNVPEDEIIDIFPKCYGARLSIDQNDKGKVDKNAALILENLIVNGYKVADRLKSFDYNHAVMILKYLAKYHAVPIAMRRLKPKLFKEECMDPILKFNMNAGIDQDQREEMFQASINDMKRIPEINEHIINKFIEVVELDEKYMNERLIHYCNGIFHTFAHFDFWINNMLILNDSNGDPIKMKMVDFQLVQFESLATDVIFFLFSSVQSELLDEKWTEFLKIYYDHFILYLQQTGCPIDIYSYEKFLDEINKMGPLQIPNIIFMLKVIFMEKDAAPENFDDVDLNVFHNENAYGPRYFDKLKHSLLMFRKLGFL